MKKWAFNANFERVCLSKYLKEDLMTPGWRCSMVLSASLGLPLSLEAVGSVLNLPYQKLKEGKSLINFFCCPNKDNKRNLPNDDKLKWQSFKEYNKRDVLVEMEIQKRFSKYPLPESEWENYYLDQIINDRGIMIDKDFVRAALICDEKYKKNVKSKLKNLTQIEKEVQSKLLRILLKSFSGSSQVKVNLTEEALIVVNEDYHGVLFLS